MITEEDLAKLDEITFVLEGRDKPTLVCLSVASYKKAEELSKAVEERLPAYRFETLNLRGQQVGSLFQAIREQVPARVLESRPVEYVLHVFGLEDSLFVSRGNKPTLSTLIQELNFERENLFRIFPFCILLWTTPYFVDNLKKHAQDLWDWITYSYSFDDTECAESAQVDSEHWQNLPDGRLAEREKRIEELEEKFRSLALGGGATERIIREKITVQKLLGREYSAAFRFNEAVLAYQTVLALLGQLPARLIDEEAELHYLLGSTQLDVYKLDQALEHLQTSLELQQQANLTYNIGATYHQMGRVYEGHRKWSEALESYQSALFWKEKAEKHDEFGSTYHQIGNVHADQEHWNEALESYQMALNWDKKTGQPQEMGSTHHQIGRVYEKQLRWSEALESYQKALKWKEQTRQDHEMWGTYHQIGMVYEKQQRWSDALDNYDKALIWEEKTGQIQGMGRTYHQIGTVYEKQRRWSKALTFYLHALVWIIPYDAMSSNRAKSSVTRIRGKIREPIRERLLEQITGQMPDDLKNEISLLLLGKPAELPDSKILA